MNKEYPKVSLVTTTWNRKEVLRDSLLHIHNLDYPDYEVIVVDNHSSDGTAEMIRREFSFVRLRVMPKPHYGPCEAMNIGFAQAQGEFIVVLDDDSYIEKDGLKKMIEVFRQNPQAGIITFHIFTATGLDWTKRLGRRMTTFDGCAAGMRRIIWDKLGGYSKDFFIYMNENDLAIRVLAAGFDILYEKEIIACHKWAPINRDNRKLLFFKVRNGLWFVFKYFTGIRLFIGTGRIIIPFFYLSLKENTFSFYLKAILSATFGIPRIFRKRKPVGVEIQRRYLKEDWFLSHSVSLMLINKLSRCLGLAGKKSV